MFAQAFPADRLHSFPSELDSMPMSRSAVVRYSGGYKRCSATAPPAKLSTALATPRSETPHGTRVCHRRKIRQGGSSCRLPWAWSSIRQPPPSGQELVYRHLPARAGVVDISTSPFRSPPSLWRIGCNLQTIQQKPCGEGRNFTSGGSYLPSLYLV